LSIKKQEGITLKLPDDYGERARLTPTIITALVSVTLFTAAILAAVLLLNSRQNRSTPTPTAPVIETSDTGVRNQEEEHYTSSDDLLTGNSLSPKDLDFWDMYPQKEEEPVKNAGEASVEVTDNDPATDGRHTLIQYAGGEEEWVLISPYLPKHNYDFTKLVCQSNIMKYYEDGKQISYVGADISKYQDYVDFVKLKKAGVDYVMLRVGARGYSSGQIVIDEYFSDNIKRASDAGLEVGLYFYSQAVTEEEAIEEAEIVLENIQDYDITWPIAFCMEYMDNDTARVEALSKTEKTAIARAFLEKIREAGYLPMIYGDKEWLIKRIDMSKLTAYDIWLSQETDIPDYPYKFSMWQYTTSVTINGIAGPASLNISFIDYSEK